MGRSGSCEGYRGSRGQRPSSGNFGRELQSPVADKQYWCPNCGLLKIENQRYLQCPRCGAAIEESQQAI